MFYTFKIGYEITISLIMRYYVHKEFICARPEEIKSAMIYVNYVIRTCTELLTKT